MEVMKTASVTYRNEIKNQQYLQAQRLVSRQIYGRDMKAISHWDGWVFMFCSAVLMYLILTLGEWHETFYDYYGDGRIRLLLYALAVLLVVFAAYAFHLRPGKIFACISEKSRAVSESPTRIDILPDGLHCEISFARSVYRYSSVKQILRSDGYLLIFLEGTLYLAVPDSAFENEAGRQHFQTALEEALEAAGQTGSPRIATD